MIILIKLNYVLLKIMEKFLLLFLSYKSHINLQFIHYNMIYCLLMSWPDMIYLCDMTLRCDSMLITLQSYL